MSRILKVGLLAAAFVSCRNEPPAEIPVKPEGPPTTTDPAAYWSDGYAELAGYSLERVVDGRKVVGTAALVFVQETFAKSKLVKAEPGQHPQDDLLPVMKLNSVKNLKPGHGLDLNNIVSVFVPWTPQDGLRAGLPLKLTYSLQDRKGSAFDELRIRSGDVELLRTRGADETTAHIGSAKGAIFVDALPLLARRIPRDTLREGERRAVRILDALEHTTGSTLAFGPGTLFRGRATTATVPAGRFEVENWGIEVVGRRYEVWVERAFPHRVIRWQGPFGEVARFLGSQRMKYWQLNRNRDEGLLKALGLRPVYEAAPP